MKSIKEILELGLDNIETIINYNHGLCGLFMCLKFSDFINDKEYLKIIKYLKKNKPYFTYNNIFKNSSYWWKPGKVKPRKKWLIKHIKKNT